MAFEGMFEFEDQGGSFAPTSTSYPVFSYLHCLLAPWGLGFHWSLELGALTSELWSSEPEAWGCSSKGFERWMVDSRS